MKIDVGGQVRTGADWRKAWRQSGREALRGAGPAGRRPKLSRDRLAEVAAALANGAEANGYTTLLPAVTS